MDGWRDGWRDGGKDGWVDGWMDGWMDGRINRWVDGSEGGLMEILKDVFVEALIKWWNNRRMNECACRSKVS